MEHNDFFRKPDLVELIKFDPSLKLDIRYATSDNFIGRPVYPEPRAFLQRPAAEGLLRVSKKLKAMNFGLLIYDAYRPWSVTKLFWELTPEDKRKYVADPATGSVHNRGCAVDLSLYDLQTGAAVAMPSEFDEQNEKAHINYTGGLKETLEHRDLLKMKMEEEKFLVCDNEWWHFDFEKWEYYEIQDIPFSNII